MSEGNHSDVPESGTNVNELEVKRNINETNLIASQLNNAAANECAANEVITNKSVYDAPDAANEGAANQVITNQSVYGAPDTDIVEASKQKSENPIKANLVCETTNDAIIMIDRALCANYRSDSESDSVDSEPDSSTSSSISSRLRLNEILSIMYFFMYSVVI